MAGIWSELNRRNVTRVAIAYAVAGWLLTEVASVVLPTFSAPEWVLKVLIALLVMGFPLVMIFSWVYELTPEGLKKESEIDRSQSVTGQTAKKLNVVVIVLLVVAIALVSVDRFVLRQPTITGGVAPSGKPLEDLQDDASPSIAVLAFENMSADADNAYFADGISEEILNLLSDVRDLAVASRTSAFAFRGKDVPIPEIASALNVRYVLEGSVRKAGAQVRVTAQLIDAETDRHLWSDTYDRTLQDIFSIQDEIAGSIGQALRVQLLGEGGYRVRSEVIDPDVYAEFLDARYRLRRRNHEDMRAANEMLIGVVAAEPTFARAHVVLGEAYLLNTDEGALVPENLASDLARMHAGIAHSLNPELAGIDLILGSLAQGEADLVAAVAHFDRAVELEPTEPRPYHWRGLLYSHAGYAEHCRTDLERALELDPQNPNVHFALAACLLIVNETDRARALASRGATLGNPGGYGLVVHAEFLAGDTQAAIQATKRHIEEMGGDPEVYGHLLSALGDPTAQDPAPAQDFSEEQGLPLMLGDADAWFDAVSEETAVFNSLTVTWAPQYSELRRDPRYQAVLDRVGVTSLWRAKGPPTDCRSEGADFSCGHGGAPAAH